MSRSQRNNSKDIVLVVAAHPDDEVLGCGGTMAKLAREGHQISIAILGEGVTSRTDKREQANPAEIEKLKARSQAAGKLIGAKEVFNYDLPDNRFDTVALLDIVKIIEALVTKLSPQTIYTHHAGDLNIDHQLVNRAVLTATRPMKGQSVREIFAFEVPSSTEWAFQRIEPSFRANTFMDIGSTLETKTKAMALYESEARAFPHPRSTEALNAIAKRWGSVIGCDAAEAFEVIRAIS